MFTPEPPLKFPPAEQSIADRLLKIAAETDRIEGYTQPHAIAIARLAEVVATRLDMRGHDLTSLLLAALAHDIGERSLKRHYLLRPDALTWEETLDLWRHPMLGEQQAAELNLPRQARLLIRWHHEWWNGEGYPDALAGEAIPLGARILRVVDSYCALTTKRPYREAFDPLDAEQIIAEQAGIELDPTIVQILLEYLEAERTVEESDLSDTGEAGETGDDDIEIIDECEFVDGSELIDGSEISAVIADDETPIATAADESVEVDLLTQSADHLIVPITEGMPEAPMPEVQLPEVQLPEVQLAEVQLAKAQLPESPMPESPIADASPAEVSVENSPANPPENLEKL